MEPPFQSNEIAGHFLAILGHLGSFLGHFGSYLGHFGPFLGHFVAFLDKFAESSIFFAGSLESRDSLLDVDISR